MPFTLPAHPFNFSERQLHKLYNEGHRTRVVVSSEYESSAASAAGCLPSAHTLLSTSILTHRTRATCIVESGLRLCPGPGPRDPRGIWYRPLWEIFLPEYSTTLQRLLSLSHEDVQNKKKERAHDLCATHGLLHQPWNWLMLHRSLNVRIAPSPDSQALWYLYPKATSFLQSPVFLQPSHVYSNFLAAMG